MTSTQSIAIDQSWRAHSHLNQSEPLFAPSDLMVGMPAGINEHNGRALTASEREMSYTIEPHAGGNVNLSQPQQRWYSSDDSGLLASARFAGQEMVAITDDSGAFDLMYLGFQAKGFTSLEEAQRAAPEFARRVLQRLSDLIAD